jgi:hypothetical protein
VAIYVWRLWYVHETNDVDVRGLRLSGGKNPGRRNFIEPRLSGLNYVSWPIGQPLHAKCRLTECCVECEKQFSHTNQDIAPDVNCTCGIYGLKQPDDLIQHAATNVLGVAELWGKIITAEYGYRAEIAQLRALINVSDSIATAYRVPNLPTIDYAEKEYFS